MLMLKNNVSKDHGIVNLFTIVRKISELSTKMSPGTDNVTDDKEVSEIPSRFSEEELNRKRNKSKLRDNHRNLLFNKIPYSQCKAEHHQSVKYKRRLFGRYGFESGINPSICWPTPDDLLNFKEYESLARPLTVQEMIKINVESKEADKKLILQREEEIASKLSKLEKWKAELDARIKKKETEALIAKEKKDRLIEEVRRHFGFKVDPKDERFKEMLEKKEKQEKKLAKEAKRKEREAKALANLLEASGKSEIQKPS